MEFFGQTGSKHRSLDSENNRRDSIRTVSSHENTFFLFLKFYSVKLLHKILRVLRLIFVRNTANNNHYEDIECFQFPPPKGARQQGVVDGPDCHFVWLIRLCEYIMVFNSSRDLTSYIIILWSCVLYKVLRRMSSQWRSPSRPRHCTTYFSAPLSGGGREGSVWVTLVNKSQHVLVILNCFMCS